MTSKRSTGKKNFGGAGAAGLRRAPSRTSTMRRAPPNEDPSLQGELSRRKLQYWSSRARTRGFESESLGYPGPLLAGRQPTARQGRERREADEASPVGSRLRSG